VGHSLHTDSAHRAASRSGLDWKRSRPNASSASMLAGAPSSASRGAKSCTHMKRRNSSFANPAEFIGKSVAGPPPKAQDHIEPLRTAVAAARRRKIAAQAPPSQSRTAIRPARRLHLASFTASAEEFFVLPSGAHNARHGPSQRTREKAETQHSSFSPVTSFRLRNKRSLFLLSLA
jgi:hypothetical protein